MATNQDFVPREAEIDVLPAYFQDGVKNFASDEEIVSNVLQSITQYEGRFIGQRHAFITENTGIWNLQDYAFRCGLNDASTQSQKSKGANEPDKWERAKIGSTLFYRQVRQKAANLYAVLTSKDMPFKYVGISTESGDTPEAAKKRAETLNLLAKWSMKSDNFNHKSMEFCTQVGKNGNTPVFTEWIQRRGKKKIAVPVFADDGVTIESYDIQEVDGKIVENRPTMNAMPIESVMADLAIGDLQSQECVIASGIVGISEIINGISTGIYDENVLERIGRAQQWDGTSGGFENEDNKKRNRGFDNVPETSGTGQYLRRDAFINLPIDEISGKWDDLKYVPKRYRVTLFGNTPNNSAVARIERNQEPDDTIPIEMIHANPDDSDLLYHISDYEVVQSNMAAETTIKRQLIDNNTLINKPPLVEVNGTIQGNGRGFGPDARWIVDSPNDVKILAVPNLSQTNIQVLENLQEDSNRANSIDKNMLGEALGGRTSAGEAGTVAANSRRPNLVNIEYILNQYLGFYARRLKVYWEAYGTKDQVVQITDKNDNIVHITPKDISGEYDIVIDIMDDIKEDAVEAQKLTNYAQVMGSIPQLSQTVDWTGFSEHYSEKILGTSKFVVANNEGDATQNAMNNVAIMLNTGAPPNLDPSMSLKKHLEIYKQERMRWQGYEEQNENIAVLDQAIAQLEQMVHQGGGQGGANPQGSLPGTPTDSVAAGQQLSGVLGGT